ncbi:hypothetical protein FKW77_001739 [Venturia effusa]|uniref:Uncharacterized protein n=1 Tax=Venturia effusa TaxID=50376 RepID=A0A517LJT4_9PEZI|nr:hypothetical protein FKW77_001739 [Venturia effusa]
MKRQRETKHTSLSFSDKRFSSGSHEKSRACWLGEQIRHQRKRMEMLVKKIAEKGGFRKSKGILVTTRIEVVSTPVASPTSPNVIFHDYPTVTATDFPNELGPASPRSMSRLMVLFPPSFDVDVEVGAERVNSRRHSLPFTSSRTFQRLTTMAPRSRASPHNGDSTSTLGMEAEWAQCLERTTNRSLRSCGKLENKVEEEAVVSEENVKRRFLLNSVGED